MITRDLTASILEAASQFPVIAVLGPRQSGKTTLVQKCFPNYKYISLEDLLEILQISMHADFSATLWD